MEPLTKFLGKTKLKAKSESPPGGDRRTVSPRKLEEALRAGFGNSLIIQTHLTLDLVKAWPFETQSRSLQVGTDKLVYSAQN